MKELLILGFVATTALQGHGSQEQLALRTSSRAFYKQSGAETEINKVIQKEVPKNLRLVAGNAFLIAKTIQDKRLTITWSF